MECHLATCPACRAELSDLAGLPSLLRKVPPDVVRQLLAENPVQVVAGPPLGVLLGRVAAVCSRGRVPTIAGAIRRQRDTGIDGRGPS